MKNALIAALQKEEDETTDQTEMEYAAHLARKQWLVALTPSQFATCCVNVGSATVTLLLHWRS